MPVYSSVHPSIHPSCVFFSLGLLNVCIHSRLRPLVLVPQRTQLPLRIDAPHEHLRDEDDDVDEGREVREPDVAPVLRGGGPAGREEADEDEEAAYREVEEGQVPLQRRAMMLLRPEEPRRPRAAAGASAPLRVGAHGQQTMALTLAPASRSCGTGVRTRERARPGVYGPDAGHAGW